MRPITLSILTMAAQVVADQKPLTSNDASSANPFTEEFNSYVAELMEEWRVPGLSIAVVDGDKIFSKVNEPWNHALSITEQLGLWLRNTPRCPGDARNLVFHGFNFQSPDRRVFVSPHSFWRIRRVIRWMVYTFLVNHS